MRRNELGGGRSAGWCPSAPRVLAVPLIRALGSRAHDGRSQEQARPAGQRPGRDARVGRRVPGNGLPRPSASLGSYHQGNPVTLAAYLDAQKVNDRTAADEQSVVDQLGRRLLEALGYGAADVRYNARLSAGRPDYVIHLAGTTVTAPLFVLEDKSTDVRDLRKKQTGRAGEESPVDQLRRYTPGPGASAATRGPALQWLDGRGMAVRRRWRLPRRTPRRAHAGQWHRQRTRERALSSGAIGCSALWAPLEPLLTRVFRGDSREKRRAPPAPTEEWALRIREAFQQSPEAGARAVDGHYEADWRSWALRCPPLHRRDLVDTLRRLIDGFTYDVRHQLDDALAPRRGLRRRAPRGLSEQRHATGASHAPSPDRAPQVRSDGGRLRDTRPRAASSAWLKSPKPGGAVEAHRSSRIQRELSDHVVVNNTEDAIQPGLLPEVGPKVIAKISKADQDATAAPDSGGRRRPRAQPVHGCRGRSRRGGAPEDRERFSPRASAALHAFVAPGLSTVSPASVMVGADERDPARRVRQADGLRLHRPAPPRPGSVKTRACFSASSPTAGWCAGRSWPRVTWITPPDARTST